MAFIKELSLAFAENASSENAMAMEKYMKNIFRFHGIKTGLRRNLLKTVYKTNQDEVVEHARDIAMRLYTKKEREYHYSAIEILIRELKKDFRKEDIVLIEHLLVTHAWWDSVDTISKYLLGGYLKHFPDEVPGVVQRFSASDNIWLNRAGILYQLGYKKATNELLLFSECGKHCHSKEFFIQKAIGWALREYAKTNPDSVKRFVAKAGLKPLSTREALKNL